MTFNALTGREYQLCRGEQRAWHEGMSMDGWYPVTLWGKPLRVCWRHLGQRCFAEPFFDNTLSLQPPAERLRCETPLAALGQISDTIAPNAFIFHISRCGSTLLTQMLAALPDCVVMSEPPVIDAVLRRHHDLSAPAADTVALLRLAIGALGQRRAPAERNLIVKFDCWHIHSLPLIQAAFPATPCLFLYRDPVAVLASHQRQRGPQMVPGLIHPALLPLPRHGLAAGDLDGYAALVLEGFFETAQYHARARNLALMNYADLPGIVSQEWLRRWGIEATITEQHIMAERAGHHSKHRARTYQGDPPGASRHAIPATLIEHYMRLQSLT